MKGLREFRIVIDDDKLQDGKRYICGHVHVGIGVSNVTLRKEIKVKYICKAWTDWKEMNLNGIAYFKNMQLLAKHKIILHQTQDVTGLFREANELLPNLHRTAYEEQADVEGAVTPYTLPRFTGEHESSAVKNHSNLWECFQLESFLPGSRSDPPLEPGEYDLPFDFTVLVSTLPPSFEGPYGKIKHRIKAVLRSTLKESAKDEWEFHRSPILDLNTQEHLAHPIAVDKVIYGVLGRLSKPLKTFHVTVNKGGYVPGESVRITIETNKDCRTKHPIEANLRQVVQFVGSSFQSINNTQKRTIANVLSSVVCDDECEEGLVSSTEGPSACVEQTDDMFTITMPELTVPPTPPSGLTGVKIITLEYDVMLTSKHMDVKIPIVIGNVPLHAIPHYDEAPPSFDEEPAAAEAEMLATKEPLPAEDAAST